jgi:alkanesulfonate monooxygenase
MAATYQRVSRGRLLLNVVTGGDDAEQQRSGDHEGKEARYRRAPR